MAKRLQFGDLNEWIELNDSGLSVIESVWAKVEYHKDYQLAKSNILFHVRSRVDILPDYIIIWNGNQYAVQNIAQVDKDFTTLECDLPSGLKPAP